MANIKTDLEFALSLHYEINRMSSEENITELCSTELNQNHKECQRIIEILSDDSDTETVVDRRATHRSRSPVQQVVSRVTFENQQAITVK